MRLYYLILIVILAILAANFFGQPKSGTIECYINGKQVFTTREDCKQRSIQKQTAPTITTPQPIYQTPAPVKITWGGPELWDAVNKRRVENGVNVLQQRSELCTIAAIRLNQLLELGKLDGHQGFETTLKRSDIAPMAQKFSNISEFLVVGYSTPKETVDAWEHTLGHKVLVAGGEYVWGCIYAQDSFGVAITAY